MMNDDNLREGSSDDWMESLLRTPIFQNLPPVYLQQILINLQDVRYKPGEIIIEQGSAGKYFYLIRSGLCELTRKASEKARAVKLLELGENETFGEDSLLSGEPRSVTISAISDMLLSRIDKEHFIKLIKEPALKYIDYAELVAKQQGGAVVIDIREAGQFAQNHVEGSRNIPFFSLRLHTKDLEQQKNAVIVVCNDGTLSEAGAFVLLKNSVDVFILKAGIQGIDASADAQGTGAIVQDDSAEDRLKKENITLRSEVAQLKNELDMLAKKNRMLIKQTDKLKAVLDRKV